MFTRRGICHLPEGRGIFPSLSVHENLTIQARTGDLRAAIEKAGQLFPVVGERLDQTAGSLSGGEQQMLALYRAYITQPKVVLVDEAIVGSGAPGGERDLRRTRHAGQPGATVVVVEQCVQKALALADTVYILNRGEVAHVGSAKEIDTADICERSSGSKPPADRRPRRRSRRRRPLRHGQG